MIRRILFRSLTALAVVAVVLASSAAAGAAARSPHGRPAPTIRLRPTKAATLADYALVSTSANTVEAVSNVTSGTPASLGSINDSDHGDGLQSIALDPAGNTGLVAENNTSLFTLTHLHTKPAYGNPVGLAQFYGEGEPNFSVATVGVAAGNGFALAAVEEQGVVQLRELNGQWQVDSRVHSPGLSRLPAPHAPGWIAFPKSTTPYTYDGVAVSPLPLADGEYLGLAIDRTNDTVAVIKGVGSATPKVTALLTSTRLGDLDGNDDGNGGMVFSPVTPTRAVVATENGLVVLNLSNPAKPKLQSVTPAGTFDDGTSVAIAPDGNHVVMANGAEMYAFTGLLHATGSKALTPDGTLTPPSSAVIFAMAFVRNGNLIINRADTTPTYYLSVVKGMETGSPTMGEGITLGGGPEEINDLAVTPALATVAIHPAKAPKAKVGKHLSVKLSVAGGVGTFHFAVSGGHLPAGLRLHGAKITGTPKTKGTKHVAIRATNQYGGAVFAHYTFTVK